MTTRFEAAFRQSAANLYYCFETRTRASGAEEVTLHGDAPMWIHDMLETGPSYRSPDHWRCLYIRYAAGYFSDNGYTDDYSDFDNAIEACADDSADLLIQWLASSAERIAYCDHAAAEYGNPTASLIERIKAGQSEEIAEVFDLVLRGLTRKAEEV